MVEMVFYVIAAMHYVYCAWQSGIWFQDETEEDQTARNNRTAAADAARADDCDAV